MKIRNIYNYLDTIAPYSTAAQWDNTGLCVGSLNGEVTKVLLSLDVTNEVVEKALQTGAQVVLTHHPLIFDGVKSIEEGTVLYNAVRSGLTFISSHTCLDKAKGGVNDCLAEVVGIKNIRNSDVDEFLKIGEIEPMTADELAKRIKDTLCGKVTYTDNGKLIRTVALCSGSGGDLVSVAAVEGADALLTGEAKHHEMLDSQTLGVSLFVAGHYETENIVLEHLKTALENEFDGLCVEIFSPAPVKYL